MPQGKVTARKFTSKGLLLEVDNNGETVRQLITAEQVSLMNLVGAKIPVVGQEVSYEFSANPTTGVVSTEWVTVNM